MQVLNRKLPLFCVEQTKGGHVGTKGPMRSRLFRDLNIDVIFFSRKLYQLFIFSRSVLNEYSIYSICWELTCDGLVSHPGGVKDSYSLNTTEIGDKRRLHGPLDSERTKVFS